MMVGGVSSGPGHLENTIKSGKRLTNVRAVPNVSRCLRERDLRHG